MVNLTLLENQLVPVYTTDTGEKAVYGTELHEVLNVKSPYREWSSRRLKDCDAIENKDYEGVEISTASGQTMKEHIIQLATAKEMAMLERNAKGKQVRRYFIGIEDKYNEEKKTKKNKSDKDVAFREQVECIEVVGDILHLNDASKLYMLEGLYKCYNLPTAYLPKYEFNGSREMKSATELLKRFELGMSVKNFNLLMLEHGYLEEKERKSSSSASDVKKYKALTEKGLKYGENAVSPHNQREVQPLYYVDVFEELFNIIVREVA